MSDRNPNAHLSHLILQRPIGISGTLGRRSASTGIGLSLCAVSLITAEVVECLIGLQDVLIRNFGQFPRVIGSDGLFRVERPFDVSENLLERVEGAALECLFGFSAYEKTNQLEL